MKSGDEDINIFFFEIESMNECRSKKIGLFMHTPYHSFASSNDVFISLRSISVLACAELHGAWSYLCAHLQMVSFIHVLAGKMHGHTHAHMMLQLFLFLGMKRHVSRNVLYRISLKWHTQSHVVIKIACVVSVLLIIRRVLESCKRQYL